MAGALNGDADTKHNLMLTCDGLWCCRMHVQLVCGGATILAVVVLCCAVPGQGDGRCGEQHSCVQDSLGQGRLCPREARSGADGGGALAKCWRGTQQTQQEQQEQSCCSLQQHRQL